jgi:lipopolysaccharide export system permease protein
LRLDVLPENMSYSELRHFIGEIKRNGGDPKRWLTDLHFKVSIPFASFIMVLFGTPLAARKRKSGIIFGAIVSLIVCLIYYGFTKFIQTLGQTGTLEPLVAAWSTNLGFLVAGIILMWAVRK